MKFLLVFFFALFFLFFDIGTTHAQDNSVPLQFEAIVTEISENSQIIEENGNKHPYQMLQLLGTSGSIKGKTINIENGSLNQSNIIKYELGDKVMLNLSTTPDGKGIYTITDYVRRAPLYFLIALFVILTIIIGGKRGANSLLGMVLTFGALFVIVLPQISNGANPVIVTSIALIIIIPITFFLSHGVNKKTISAIISTFVVITITSVMSQIFIAWAHLTGFVSEEASFLNTLKQGTLDARGLLFAGIIIALLGVLEDITVAQSAIVNSLYNTDKKQKLLTIYTSAMNIGKDHIASMANTLILVYAGASLPLLLLFIDNPLPFNQLLNFEIIAEEVVRTLVASIGLIIAVPITTIIAILLLNYKKDTPKK